MNMRICLITDVFPARPHAGSGPLYISELASGLAQIGHEVTVLCNEKSSEVAGVEVKVVSAESRLDALQQASRVMPEAVQSAREQVRFWHAFGELSDTHKFDVVETFQSRAGTLIAAIAGEIPVVVRMDSSPAGRDDSDFDGSFEQLVVRYVLACADAYSCADSSLSGVDSERICINSEAAGSALAGRQAEIYAVALERYGRRSSPRLYRHGARRFVKSAEGMIRLYDNMLYDLLFRVSYRFRLKHWWKSFALIRKASA